MSSRHVLRTQPQDASLAELMAPRLWLPVTSDPQRPLNLHVSSAYITGLNITEKNSRGEDTEGTQESIKAQFFNIILCSFTFTTMERWMDDWMGG